MNPERSAVEKARRELQEARRAIEAEIRSYPVPIAGCDAQFNHLLAERRRIARAPQALNEECHPPVPGAL